MSDIRNLLARAQESEVKGRKAEAAEFLRKAAAWYRDHQMLKRAGQMLRQARRVEGLEPQDAEDEVEPDDSPEPPQTPDDVFGFGADFEGDAAKVLVEDRKPTLADPSLDAWCSFCCRPKTEVGPLVAGPAGAFICAACTSLSNELRGVASAPPLSIELRALEFSLPSQRRAQERFVRLKPRLMLVIGPTGSGKSAWLASLTHADHRVFEGSQPQARVVSQWLEGAGRTASIVITAPVPPPALVLQGEHGPEPLHDSATLATALPSLDEALITRFDAIHAFDAPGEQELVELAGHLAARRGLVLPEATVRLLVALSLRSNRGAHELMTLLARIPPGTYRPA